MPRWSGDTANFMPVLGNTKVLPEALDEPGPASEAKLGRPTRRPRHVDHRLAFADAHDQEHVLGVALVRLDGRTHPAGDVLEQIAGAGEAESAPCGPKSKRAVPAWT